VEVADPEQGHTKGPVNCHRAFSFLVICGLREISCSALNASPRFRPHVTGKVWQPLGANYNCQIDLQ
jgi:hypothetical protein